MAKRKTTNPRRIPTEGPARYADAVLPTCPSCGSIEIVPRSRFYHEPGRVKWRYCACQECGHRFITYYRPADQSADAA